MGNKESKQSIQTVQPTRRKIKQRKCQTKTLFVIGKTGEGKSTWCNSKLKRLRGIPILSNESNEERHNPFGTSDELGSCTQAIQAVQESGYNIVDGPGFTDGSDISDMEVEFIYKDAISTILAAGGEISAFIIVHRDTRWNNGIVKTLIELFGEEVLYSIIFVFLREKITEEKHRTSCEYLQGTEPTRSIKSSQIVLWSNKEPNELQFEALNRSLESVEPYWIQDLEVAAKKFCPKTKISLRWMLPYALTPISMIATLGIEVASLGIATPVAVGAGIAFASWTTYEILSTRLSSDTISNRKIIPRVFLSTSTFLQRKEMPAFNWIEFSNLGIKSLIWAVYDRTRLFNLIVNIPPETTILNDETVTKLKESAKDFRVLIPYFGPPEDENTEVVFMIASLNTIVNVEEFSRKSAATAIKDIQKYLLETKILRAKTK